MNESQNLIIKEVWHDKFYLKETEDSIKLKVL